MKYKPRPGIVYTTICGVNLLIPTRRVFDVCDKIEILTGLRDAAWRSLCNGNTVENLMKGYQILTKCSDAEAEAYFKEYCDDLCQRGYLLPDDEASS